MAGKQRKFIVRNRHFLLLDLAIFAFSGAASFFIRLETPEPRQLIEQGAIHTLRLSERQSQTIAEQMPTQINAFVQAAERHDEPAARDLLSEIVFSRLQYDHGDACPGVDISRSQQSLSGVA